MSIEDLERSGILLPREEWGTKDIHSKVEKLPLLMAGVFSVVSVILMYTGNGQLLTWIGLGVYLLSLGIFTWLSLRGIE